MLRLPTRSTLFPYTTLFRSSVLPSGVKVKFSGTEGGSDRVATGLRSEEHTSELQSRFDLVCRLLLEKKKDKTDYPPIEGDVHAVLYHLLSHADFVHSDVRQD